MNKEEILEKSREENLVSDERNNLISLEGAKFSYGVLICLWILITRILNVPLDEIGRISLGLITTATCLSNFAYQLVKGKTKTAIVFTILFTMGTMAYVYQLLIAMNILPF